MKFPKSYNKLFILKKQIKHQLLILNKVTWKITFEQKRDKQEQLKY